MNATGWMVVSVILMTFPLHSLSVPLNFDASLTIELEQGHSPMPRQNLQI